MPIGTMTLKAQNDLKPEKPNIIIKVPEGENPRQLRRLNTMFDGHVMNTTKVVKRELDDGTKMINDYIIVKKLGK